MLASRERVWRQIIQGCAKGSSPPHSHDMSHLAQEPVKRDFALRQVYVNVAQKLKVDLRLDLRTMKGHNIWKIQFKPLIQCILY